MEKKRLSLGTKLGFGVCDLGGNLFFTLIGFYALKYITDVTLLAPALAGTALLVGKIWDAVIDPFIGFLSDRTKSKLGRRRPWMLGGTVSLIFLMILMFTNPHIQSQGWLFMWIVCIYCLMVTAYSVINIPYGALTPELSPDYDEQTTLNAFRMSFAVIGTFCGAGLALMIVGMFTNVDMGWMVMGGVMGAIVSVTALITIITVKEPARAPAEAADQKGFLKTYAAALKNKPFMIALITYALHMCGTSMIMAALAYYFDYIYAGAGNMQIALVCLLVPALACIPLWTVVSKKIGKRLAYNLGMALFAAAVITFFILGNGRGPIVIYVCMLFGGIGFSTNYVMPFAIIPDTVELDYAQTGVRREGAFYGLWNLIQQIGQAFGNAMVGWTLALFGYVANVDQTASAKLGIRLLVGPLAGIFIIAGVVALSFYPITRKYYDEKILPKVAAWDKKQG
jgi:glycoside/pentoside/hexuronide:cation symporter, GPH family